jgi:hypothetical protein
MANQDETDRQVFKGFITSCARELGKKPWFVAGILPSGELVSASSLTPTSQVALLERLIASLKQGPEWTATQALKLKEPKS